MEPISDKLRKTGPRKGLSGEGSRSQAPAPFQDHPRAVWEGPTQKRHPGLDPLVGVGGSCSPDVQSCQVHRCGLKSPWKAFVYFS